MNALALLVTRLERGYAASALGPVSFVFVAGERDAGTGESVRLLKSGLESGGWEKIRSLVWNEPVEAASCWLKGDGWALSFDDPAG
ncbi:MAG: hypothetical protein WDN31_04465 [Hyphomicrobium sp.]